MHNSEEISSWVKKWSHLVRPDANVLDIACGHGRHMKWFAGRACTTTGVDISADALKYAVQWGEVVQADIENGPWPFAGSLNSGQTRTFDVVVVTNYLWRPLVGVIRQSLAPGGVLFYETFAQGNETVGKPSRPDFLLRPGELLQAFAGLRVVAFEDGFLPAPDRFVQRLVAITPDVTPVAAPDLPHRYTL